MLDKNRSGRHLVEHGGAPGFFALPSDAAIAAARARPEPAFGFISGHTSAAAAFGLSLALGFGGGRRRWIVLAVGAAVAMGLSRMHLDRHFLGDVLGGLALGLGVAWWVAAWMRRLAGAGIGRWLPMSGIAAALVVASLALGMPPPGSAGYVVGALLCIAWFERHGLPPAPGTWWQRIARGVCVLALGYGVMWLSGLAYEAGDWHDGHPVALLFACLGTALVFIATAGACRLLRLDRPSPAGPAR